MAISGVAAIAIAALAFALSPNTAAQHERAAIEEIVRNYLMENPEILVEMSNALDVRQSAVEEAARNEALAELGLDALVDPQVAYVSGPEDAPVTVVEFFDYRCGFCKASLPATRAAMENNENVRFAFIEYPILSPESIIAAHAAVAARRQPGKYVPFHIALMEATGNLPRERILSIAQSVGLDVAQLEIDMEDPAVADSIEASRQLADRLLIGGTPTFIIGQEFVIGEMSQEELQHKISEAQG